MEAEINIETPARLTFEPRFPGSVCFFRADSPDENLSIEAEGWWYWAFFTVDEPAPDVDTSKCHERMVDEQVSGEVKARNFGIRLMRCRSTAAEPPVSPEHFWDQVKVGQLPDAQMADVWQAAYVGLYRDQVSRESALKEMLGLIMAIADDASSEDDSDDEPVDREHNPRLS